MHHSRGNINRAGVTLEWKGAFFPKVWRDSIERRFSRSPVAPNGAENGQFGISPDGARCGNRPVMSVPALPTGPPSWNSRLTGPPLCATGT
jgi:hypothetical protein